MREKLDELWRQRPFKPFKLRLADGHTYVVRRPDHFMVLKSTFYLSLPDRVRFILRDIGQIAALQPMGSRKAKR
jgi:hypothetical protein